MTRKDKFSAKLLCKPTPKDIKFNELKVFLEHLGYEMRTKGKTSGSRIIFVDANKRLIMLHKSHGADPVKPKALSDAG